MGFFDGIKTSIKRTFGVDVNLVQNTKEVNVDFISTVQTCTRILTENVSRLPVLVKEADGSIVRNHSISKRFNHKFNSYLSADKSRKLIERDRVLNGNGFALIEYDARGEFKALTPITYSSVEGIVLKDGHLYYAINHKNNTFSERNDTEVVADERILHFVFSNIKDFVGISPIASLVFETSIKQRASETLVNFYKNNAMSPLVLTSVVQDLSQLKALEAFTDKFQLDNAGSGNAGKVIKLPPGMKLDSIDYKLADAELINTLKFTNEQIISSMGIPSFLMSYETTQSIENQTLEFKTFTLNAILAGYKAEIETKLLSTKEIEDGRYVDFDYSVLLDADLQTKAASYKLLVTNGLCTPNEAITKLGFKPIEGEGGNKHYMQMQYLDLETNINKKVEDG